MSSPSMGSQSGRSTPSDMTTSSSLGTSPSSSSSSSSSSHAHTHTPMSLHNLAMQQQYDQHHQQFHQQWTRRSSTPTSAFLAPHFWKAAAQGAQSPQPYDISGQPGNATAGFASLPRRTSFGATFGAGGNGTGVGGHGGNHGRLSALSALSMSPSNFSPNMHMHHVPEWQMQKMHLNQQQQQQPSSASSSFSDPNVASGAKLQQSSGADSIRSGSSTPTPTPTASQASSPVPTPKTQARRNVCYLPGPDGLCVESRNRRKSEA